MPAWKGSVSPWSEFTTTNCTWSGTDYGRTYTDGSFYPAAGGRSSSSGALSYVGRTVPIGLGCLSVASGAPCTSAVVACIRWAAAIGLTASRLGVSKINRGFMPRIR